MYLVIFLSTPSARRATDRPASWHSCDRFLSTPSARRATRRPRQTARLSMNFYPRPPRGGRRVVRSLYAAQITISIHALREEGDSRAARLRARNPISIHALREEGDGIPRAVSMHMAQFLSTPSARRATLLDFHTYRHTKISIHALREEGDFPSGSLCQFYQKFLSTPSARRATAQS